MNEMGELANLEKQMKLATCPFQFLWVVAETVDWLSPGRRNQLTLIGLLHFPSTSSLAFTVCINVSLNKLSHARRLSSQDVILCREDVWNASHRHTAPSPTHSPTPRTYNVPLSCSGRVQSNIARLCRVFFPLFWACQDTHWQCGVARQSVSWCHRETLNKCWFKALFFKPYWLFF